MSVPAHERLLDLIIALAQSHTAMTRADIRRTVNGYSPDDGDPRQTAAFERMFERDKETLKELGIPLVTVHGTGHYDDIGYRIDLEEYALPDVELSAAELGALAVASHVWDGSVLARHARRGLTKLRGVTTTSAETVFSPLVRLYEPDHALPEIFEALTHKQLVTFSYAAVSTGEETVRTVEPWRLSVKNQGWYLQGWDRDREANREFRLSRITSNITRVSDSFTGPAPDTSAPEEAQMVARLAVRPGAAALLRARGSTVDTARGWDVIEVPISDLTAFAGDIAAHGPAVKVLAPQELRQRVIGKLRGAARATRRAAG